MFKKALILAITAVSLSGCVGLNTVSLTSVPAERDAKVTASASDWNFIGINFNNDIVDEAVANLQQQCPTGKIEGVLTKHQTTGYVLFFKREIIATGYCNKA
ncbi:hypothetical protein JCM19232_1529 [Vibrio ishigakensis]|uniref:Lipoprotein n=1 Tax=Vibrio ishigakensis TaxID=1481914 RepID=A0A0B8QF43_9VIBR|nr:hypothetical protein [Vibrio ishigakensis]GAM58918.1 hypothetical protein JCM19231_1709 [Vibrio ishigakensis]GAM63382.1 hypothetical protein JCM19232_1529 [Vibrio ishigakensis]GAM69504.1 hypothetical protein JCM19236_4969 [Vibrio sp. JCM 19236]GAM73773.1 hypothetical protein JCM19241_4969 [Vibrio ishigakensis]